MTYYSQRTRNSYLKNLSIGLIFSITSLGTLGFAQSTTNQNTCGSGAGAACQATDLTNCTSNCTTAGSEPNCKSICTIQNSNGGPYPTTTLPACTYNCTTGGDEPACTELCSIKSATNTYTGSLEKCTTTCYAGYTPTCTSICIAQSDAYNTAQGPAPACTGTCSAGNSAHKNAPASINGLTPVLGGLPACKTGCYATGDLPVCTSSCYTTGTCPACTSNCHCGPTADATKPTLTDKIFKNGLHLQSVLLLHSINITNLLLHKSCHKLCEFAAFSRSPL